MTTQKPRFTDNTKVALASLLEPFDDNIEIVDENGNGLFAYYRINNDGDGQIVMARYDDV
jgi:hypothetical protein